MKHIYKTLLIFILALSPGIAQKAKIVIEAMTPEKLAKSGLTTNSVSSGLHVVANETFVYLSPRNIGNTEPINSASFEFAVKPSGSNSSFTSFSENSVFFRPDIKGEYKVKLTISTASGSHDTTISLFSANYVGTGNFDGVQASYPNCMTCHSNTPKFIDIYDRWKQTGHANKFKNGIDGNPSYYRESCFKCHTVGYDHNEAALNNGFDDVAANLGWTFALPVGPGKWDTLKTMYPSLAQFAHVGCESCHGPGSEHALGGPTEKIAISQESGVCGQCHDEPWRYNRYAQWENTLHSAPVWSNSFAQGTTSQNNSLQNCIRCHDGKGFVNFTKGVVTNTTGMTSASQSHIGCSTCHDPHGNGKPGSIRNTPAGSDTLAGGFQYTANGSGHLCMNCHKGRRDGNVFGITQVTNANWGPHYSVQTDVYLGKSAAEFGSEYGSSPHNLIFQNGCIDCHMVATTDTGTVNRDKVGGHTFALFNPETNYYHTTKCTPCHGQKSSWDDFIARADYDNNGQIESIPKEIDGLIKKLKYYLPPTGVDSVSWQAIRDSNNVTINKAYFNYRFFYYEGSKGMHNTMYTVNALRSSIIALGGVLSVDTQTPEMPIELALSQNYPNPFNPTTRINYTVPTGTKVKLAVYDLLGKEVAVLVDSYKDAGSYTVEFNGFNLPSGVYFYNLQTDKHSSTKKLMLMK